MKSSMKITLSLAVVAVALAGCPRDPEPLEVPAPATVRSFSATPAELTEAQAVTLSWEVEDATAVTIHQLTGEPVAVPDEAAASGSASVEVSATTTFVLSARGAGGGDSAAVQVKVAESQAQLLFAAFPAEIVAGEQLTLAWQAAQGPVQITDASGAEVHASPDAFGSVVVRPNAATEYTLTAGEQTATASVRVLPKIHSFVSDVPAAAPGEPVTLSWSVGGATSVSLSAEGRGVLASFEEAQVLLDGSYTDTIPAGVAASNGRVDYTLTATLGSVQVTQQLTVWSGTDPQIVSFDVPTYALEAGQFQVSWEVLHATGLELALGNDVIFTASTPAELAAHQLTIPSPTEAVTVTLRAWNDRGGSITRVLPVEPVGIPTLTTFEANPETAAKAGDPVTLTWNVPNARFVRISVKDKYVLHTDTGIAAESGSITVYPNGPTDYTLEADNTVGNGIPPQVETASSSTLAKLTFSPGSAPYGGSMKLTGANVPGTLQAFDFAVKNAPGEAFVDISQDGATTGHPVSTSYTMQVVELGEAFTFPMFDRVITTEQIAVNNRGWFSLFGGDQHVTTTPPSSWASILLPPFSFAPYWELLQKDAAAEIYWRLDGTGPNRRLIVQWENVRYSSTTSKRMTFQAQLYASGKVVYAYPQVYARTLTSDTPSIGIVDPTGAGVIAPRDHQLDADLRPVAGDTFTFFSTVPPAYDVGAYPVKYTTLLQLTGGGVMEIASTPEVILPGRFWISEVNPSPAATAAKGEWFEVTNATNTPYDLSGWDIEFGNGVIHNIPDTANLILPAQGVLLFAQSGDPAQNGGITPDYVYGDSYPLNDTSGSIGISVNGSLYDLAPWSSASGQAAGVSVRVDPVLLKHLYASGVTQSTCPGVGSYGTQTGTPGTRVPSCFPYRLDALPVGNFESIKATGTKIASSANGQDWAVSVSVAAGTLPNAIRWGQQTYNTLTVSDNGYLALRDVPAQAAFTCSVTNCHTTNRSSLLPTANDSRLLAVYWELMQPSTQSDNGIYLQRMDPDLTPGSGDEYTIVSWERWAYGSTATNAANYDMNFQVKFFDSGDIEYHYGTLAGSSATLSRGSGATTWLEAESGKVALVVNVNSATDPGIQPDTGWRFRFVP